MTSARLHVDPDGPNAAQIEHWNGDTGAAWRDHDERITQQIRPFGDRALARAQVTPGSRVLDVGCGSGETTRALARAVGPTGSATGLDISAPLLALARDHATREGLANVRFEHADAQLAPLPEAAFDLLFSRFGVMFFADPLMAFQNLHRALRPGGRVCFVCWRGPDRNPWLSVPFMAASLHVRLAPPAVGAPGPLSLADPEQVHGVLGAAGFIDVTLEVVAETVSIGGVPALDDAIRFMLEVGAIASALRTSEASVKAAVAASLRTVLAPWHTPEGLRLPGEAWLVTATRP